MTVDTLHTDGTRMAATSVYNGPGTTGLRVMAPTAPFTAQAHRFLYVLPVKPDDDVTFGDGFDKLVENALHNALNATLIAPEFHVEPYIADHPSNTDQRYDTFVATDLREWVIANLATTGGEEHWLLSFSKGGWSVINVLFRHPDAFTFGACYDPIITKAEVLADLGGSFAGSAIGTSGNYDAGYDPLTNIASGGAPFQGRTRVSIASGPAFNGASWTALTGALTSAGTVRFQTTMFQGDTHDWDESWTVFAADAGYQGVRKAARSGALEPSPSVVSDHQVLIDFTEGSGSPGSSGPAAPGAGTLTNGSWITNPYTGLPAVRLSAGFIDFGNFAALDNHDRSILIYCAPEMDHSLINDYIGLVDVENQQGYSVFWKRDTFALQYYASQAVFSADTGPIGLANGCWRTVIVTWTKAAKDARFYIDGVLTSTVNLAAASEAASNGHLVVGAIRNGTTFLSSLQVAQVRLYDRVLTADEAALLGGVPVGGCASWQAAVVGAAA